jgi:hypothetical protein
MSGVEAAGFVLAAFPLIMSALNSYQDGFESLQDWWRFRAEFVEFIHEIGTQSVLFSENLEELLKPIVLSDAEMDALLKEPGGRAWNNPDLEARLQQRLPQSYGWYRAAIDDMNSILEKLKAKLGIRHGQVDWSFDEATIQGKLKWAYEFRRIKFTLSKRKREKLLQSLSKRNDDLQKLMGSSDRLAPSRHQRKAPLTKFYYRVRDHAYLLHRALTSGWGCECWSSHNANLLLEDRISRNPVANLKYSDPEIQFELLFQSDTKQAQAQLLPWVWQETEVRVLEDLSYQETARTASQPHTPKSPSPRFHGASGASNALVPPNQRGSSRPSRKVEFTLGIQQYPPSKVSDPELTEIDNLCTAMQRAQQGQLRLGFLLDEHNRRYEFRPVDRQKTISTAREIVTLESLLRRDGNASRDSTGEERIILSRRERLVVAVVLSSSLLQLHSTPWLNDHWSKKNIFFLRSNPGSPSPIILERLYISPAPRPSTVTSSQAQHMVNPTTSAANDSRKIILALGIMLLELCFGQALEDQSFRKKYMGQDGQPNDFTDVATAMQWENDALGEGGPGFQNAIRRCVHCAFGPKSTDLADYEFKEAVYSEVVQPLEETLQRFDNVVY